MADDLTLDGEDIDGVVPNVKSMTVDGDQVSIDVSVPADLFYPLYDPPYDDFIELVGYDMYASDKGYVQDETTGETYNFLIAPGSFEGSVQGVGAPYGGATDIILSFTDLPGSTSFQGTLEGINPCFVAGTELDTPRGRRAVEGLVRGDLVSTAAGFEAVTWLGRRRATSARVVRFRTHALGHNKPRRDLCVSHDHAMFVDGVLVPAHLLVNGISIVEELWAAVTFYHVELDKHAIIFAEGAPAESYLDTGNRSQFCNCPLSYDASQPGAEACAEMVVSGPRLDRARAAMLAPA